MQNSDDTSLRDEPESAPSSDGHGESTPEYLTIRQLLVDTARILRDETLPITAVGLGLLAATFGILVAALALLSWVVSVQRPQMITADGQIDDRSVMLIYAEVGLPLALALVLATASSLGAVATLVDDRLMRRRAALSTVVLRGTLRAPVIAAGLVIAAGAGVLVAMATPVLMVTGIVGLVAGGISGVVRRLRSANPEAEVEGSAAIADVTEPVEGRGRLAGRFARFAKPSRRTLITMAIPGAPLVVLAARWGFVVPAAALEHGNPLLALRRSGDVAEGRFRAAGAVVLAAFLSYFPLQMVISELVTTGWFPEALVVTFQLVTQAFLTAVPVALLTVGFRDAVGHSPAEVAVAVPVLRRPGRITATAIGVVIMVIASSAFLVGSQSTVAAAQEPWTSPVWLFVDDASDDADAAPGDGACATANGTCTLRAAVDEANAVPGSLHEIYFVTDAVVYLGAPLEISGQVNVNGDSNRVTISGRPCEECAPTHQIFRLITPDVEVNLKDLTLRDGVAGPDGGGAIESVARLSIEAVTFVANTSTVPGGAVVSQGRVGVLNGTFIDNTAPEGADVAVMGGEGHVQLSTAVGGQPGSSMHKGPAPLFTVEYSILANTAGDSCTGGNDSTSFGNLGEGCGSIAPVAGLGAFGDHGGPVDTVAILAESPAVDGGNPEGCPPVDARGIRRPQGRACDIGSFELEREASVIDLVVNDLGDDPMGYWENDCLGGGTCTLRGAFRDIEQDFRQRYRITFALSGTVALAAPISAYRGFVLDGVGQKVTLSGGGTHRILSLPYNNQSVTIRNLTFADGRDTDPNDSWLTGGAAINTGNRLTVENSTFVGNIATGNGGAIQAREASLELRNVTMVDNGAAAGGDVWANWGARIDHGTFVGATGGSIFNADEASQFGDDGTIDVSGSIVSAAAGAACTGVTTGSANLSHDETCPGTLSTDLSDLGALADNGGVVETIAIGDTSRAVDVVHAFCSGTDARGVTRPQGDACDAGAFEMIRTAASTAVAASVTPEPSRWSTRPVASATVTRSGGTVPVSVGQVRFALGDQAAPGEELGVVDVTDGVASMDLVDLPVGTHDITATYLGTDDLEPSAVTFRHEVAPAEATVSLVTTPTPSALGQTVGLTVQVGMAGSTVVPTGDIEVVIDDQVVHTVTLQDQGESSAAWVDLTDLDVGDTLITARYLGDTNYPTSVGTVTHTVMPTAATVAVQADPNPSVVGQAVTLTATVSGLPGRTPTGQVAFSRGGVDLGEADLDDGVAAITTSSLAVGSGTVTATYEGDARYGTGAGTSGHTVVPAASRVTVTGTPNPSVTGQPVTLDVEVAAVAPGAGTPTGTVTVFGLDRELGSATLVDGAASIAVGALPASSHELLVTYGGSGDFAGNGTAHTQVVNRGSTTVTATGFGTSARGETVVIEAEVSATVPAVGVPTGTVSVLRGFDTLATGTLVNGAVAIPVAGLGLGVHELTVSYGGDAGFSTSWMAEDHEVVALGTVVNATGPNAPVRSGESFTIGATVGIDGPGSGDIAGEIEVVDADDYVLARGNIDEHGSVDLDLSLVPVGEHELAVRFVPEAGSAASHTNVTVEVVAAATTVTLTSSANPAALGTTVRLTATVSVTAPAIGTATGEVELYEGPNLVDTVSLSAGSASFPLDDLVLGPHVFTAVYTGDGNRASSTSAPLEQTITEVGSTVAISSDIDRSVFGQPVVFTATVSAADDTIPTGPVSFETATGAPLGTATLDGAGQAVLAVASLTVGEHEVVATYGGDGIVGGGTSDPVAHTVERAATTVVVGLPAAPTVPGETFSVEAAVAAVVPGAGRPTGEVSFTTPGAEPETPTVLGTATLGADGVARLNVALDAVDRQPISAAYAGDVSFTSSTGASDHQVVAGASSTALAVSAPTSVAGQPVTFTATVRPVAPATGTPTGTVTFTTGTGPDARTLGTAQLAAGVAEVSLADLLVGRSDVVATYAGDSRLGGSDGTADHAVGPASTSVSVTADPGALVVGQPAALRAQVVVVAPGATAIGGLVTFSAGGETLSVQAVGTDGIAEISATLPLGSQAVTAAFAPATDRLSGSSGSTTVVVGESDTTTTVAASTDSARFGEPATFIATVSAAAPALGQPTGTVTFHDGATVLGQADLAAGKASVTVALPAVGVRTVEARYLGADGRRGSTGSAGVEVVAAATELALDVSPDTAVAGSPVALVADLSVVAPGGGTPSGSIVFRADGTDIGTGVLDGAGRASVAVADLGVGRHDITAHWAGSATHGAADAGPESVTITAAGSTVTLDVDPSPSVWAAPVSLTATVAPLAGNESPTGEVVFRSGAVILGRADLDASGEAVVTTSALEAGAHQLVATYEGDAKVGPGASAPRPHTVTPSATTLAVDTSTAETEFGESLTIEATVDGAGPPSGTVTFHTNGGSGPVEIGQAPLVDGVATLAVTSLNARAHTITATYGGAPRWQSSTGTATHRVVTAPVEITITPQQDPVPHGTDPVVEIEVVGVHGTTPAGHVALRWNGASQGTRELPDGRVTVTLTEFRTTGSVTVEYLGDADHRGADAVSAVIGVGEAETMTTLTASPSLAVWGQPVTLSATVSVPGGGRAVGTVTFTDGERTVGTAAVGSDGRAVLVVRDLDMGSRRPVARFAGAGFVASVSDPASVTIQPAATATAVTAPAAPTGFGEPARFTATVAAVAPGGSPVGEVVFRVGERVLGTAPVGTDGRATIDISDLPGGTSTVTASFRSGGSHLASSGAIAHTVMPRGSTLTLEPVGGPAVAGEPITYRATLGSLGPIAPSGTVTFTGLRHHGEETVPVRADGTAEVTFLEQITGSAPIWVRATWSGDVNHTGAEGVSLLEVGPATGTVRATVRDAEVTSGEELVFDVEVGMPEMPAGWARSGFASLSADGTWIGNVAVDGPGTYELRVPTPQRIGVGTYSVTVSLAAGNVVGTGNGPDFTVTPALPVLTVTSSPSPSVGYAPVEVTVSASTPDGRPLNGLIYLYRDGARVGTAIADGMRSGPYRTTLNAMAPGRYRLSAEFEPAATSQHLAATSPEIVHHVRGKATSITPPMAARSQAGENVEWESWVRNLEPEHSTDRPTGDLVYTVAGVQHGRLGLQPHPVLGNVSRLVGRFGPLPAGTHEVTVTYVPRDANFEPSSATFTHRVEGVETVIEPSITSYDPVPWGTPVLVGWRLVPARTVPGQMPSGTVTVTDGAGQTCTGGPAGFCYMTWDSPGEPRLTATYDGDASFLASTARLPAPEVVRRDPVLRASISTDKPVTGEAMTLQWNLEGPQGGRVDALNGPRWCTDATRTGTCDYTPELERSEQEQVAGVYYAGDSHWNPTRWEEKFTPMGCFTFPLRVWPASETARVWHETTRNCGGGTGYLAGTNITVRVQPRSDDPDREWMIRQAFPANSQLDPHPNYRTIRVGNREGSADSLYVEFGWIDRCVTVTFAADSPPGQRSAFYPTGDPNCGTDEAGNVIERPRWRNVGDTVTGRLIVGTPIQGTYTTYDDRNLALFGFHWSHAQGEPYSSPFDQDPVAAADELAYRAGLNPSRPPGMALDRTEVTGSGRQLALYDTVITAVFGNRCRTLDVDSEGPGEVRIDTAPTCYDPDASGYHEGTAVKLTAVTDQRSYLDGWSGDDLTPEREPECDNCGFGGMKRNRDTATVDMGGPRSQSVKAYFGSCYLFRLSVHYDERTDGTVTAPTKGDCPMASGPNEGGELLFTQHKGFHMLAETRGESRFKGWDPGDHSAEAWGESHFTDTFSYLKVNMDEDREYRPAFFNRYTCHQISLRSFDPEFVEVMADPDSVDAGEFCPTGDLDGTYGASRTGRTLPTVLEGEARLADGRTLGGGPYVGWTANLREQHTYGLKGARVAVPVTYDRQVWAVPCAAVDVRASFVGLDDEVHTFWGRRGAGRYPEPNCPYGGPDSNLYVVGTEVVVGPDMDPNAADFLGWGGEAEGHSAEEDLFVVKVDGSKSTHSVMVNFRAKCQKLTLTHDAGDVTAYPEPDCPGATNTKNSLHYFNGAVVLLDGKVPRDKV